MIGLPFHSVLPCFMLASPVILCFTADVANKLLSISGVLVHLSRILFSASCCQSGGIDGNAAAGTVCDFAEGMRTVW